MIIEIKETKKYDVKLLVVDAGVRYWEDAIVNGIEDKEGLKIPCRNGDSWKPTIDLEEGRILGWPKGTTASIHYKICDDGIYTLYDENFNKIKKIDGYVPNMLCPVGDGYGDYIIMNVDKNGIIENFKCDFLEFQQDEEE